MTYGAELVRRPWLDGGWDLGATVFMLSLASVSLVVVAWRWRRDDAR